MLDNVFTCLLFLRMCCLSIYIVLYFRWMWPTAAKEFIVHSSYLFWNKYSNVLCGVFRQSDLLYSKMSTFPFNDLNNFDLNLLLQLQQNTGSPSISDEQYDNSITNIINNNSEEFVFNINAIVFTRIKYGYYGPLICVHSSFTL